MRRTGGLLLVGLMIGIGCRAPEPGAGLARAAFRGDQRAVRESLDRGVEVDERDAHGLTPLMWVARAGQTATLSLLLERGARVDLKGGVNDWTALQHAIHKGRLAAAERLLAAGGDVSGADGVRALRMAAGYGDAPLVRALLARGVDPGQEVDGAGILGDAVGGAWDIDYRYSGCENHTQVVAALLEKAPGLRLSDSFFDRYALRYARGQGCDRLVKMVDVR